ncbi:cytochrome P450 [Dendrothele bispora CBS 962.96]|uniref:Cytochrome P450 n=1 Tax=Dendrothele bispora (strain CBS 962.96) TaxID=1314807 RepID=A0A4V4HIG2_DENBC|nr:cytochrome P450 [Dendrothele bispora CBS 962.96]
MSDSYSVFQLITGGVVGFFLFSTFLRAQLRSFKLPHIPTIGPNGFLSSYLGGFQFVSHARKLIQEGYERYHGKAFKIRLPDQGWAVIVSGEKMVNEIKRASDDYLSSHEASRELFQTDYTLTKAANTNWYHFDVVRTTLTQKMDETFPDVRDEMIAAFDDEIPVSEDWVTYPALNTILRVVCRTTNRTFVGTPLCREPDYVNLNIEYTVDTFKLGAVVNLFPTILQPIVGHALSPLPRAFKRASKHLGPVIKARLEKEDQYGSDWEGRPNDLISWFLDRNLQGELRTVDDLIVRVLNLNIASIHATSMAFTSNLYHLAIQPPSVVSLLRKEAESAIEEHGWSKLAMGKMRRMDSFMKEVARMTGTPAMGVIRKVMKDFTFSDGTIIPAGVLIGVPAFAVQCDEHHYDSPDEFKPFRFYDMWANGTSNIGEGVKYQMATPDSEYFFFGAGKHACPGRFFAVNELKALFAHTLLTYDIKLEGDSKVLPKPVWFNRDIGPNREAKLVFRKRLK